MPSPFPGMDPYLEDPYIFPDLHHSLAVGMSKFLNRCFPRPYYARIEVRPEVGIVDDDFLPRSIVPDFLVLREPRSGRGDVAVADVPAVAGTRTEISPWVELDRLDGEPARHAFVEIRDSVRGHKLVTLIEILSPSNKSRGSDRRLYEAKQREVLDSDASLIEIDLLRAGRRVLPNVHLEDGVRRLGCAYLVSVSRAWGRVNRSLGYIFFPIGQRDPLPCIPVPLKEGEPELPMDLQHVLDEVYDAGPYRRGAVDYAAPPDPPLPAEHAEWAAALARAARA